MIILRNGTEIPLFPLGLGERLALYDTAIEWSEKPAARSVLVLAAVGFAWEAAAKLEANAPASQRSVPAFPWKPWAKCGGDIHAYGSAVIDALQDEDVMTLRRVGDKIVMAAWTSLSPPAEAVEEARKNSGPEGATSSGSSTSGASTSPTPSTSST